MKIKISLVFVFLAFSALVYSAEKRFDVPIGDSPQLGPADAPVTIIEFLDFQ